MRVENRMGEQAKASNAKAETSFSFTDLSSRRARRLLPRQDTTTSTDKIT